ncbi:MAG: E3 ubiquitin-protein ligase rad18 [Thelocarpon superellum]|nr:MAG: E3 ubiquitin-protein ligase rad18 [Thelocarpon superellum]
MDHAHSVPDSTDWLSTPLRGLAPVEAALRCQVCKDFFTTPMTTSCSHTFCSLCIRRCLAADGKCPTCRGAEQEIKLRRNGAVQEIVDAFQQARDATLLFARRSEVGDAPLSSSSSSSKKRKADDLGLDEGGNVAKQMRKTRSQSRRDEDATEATVGESVTVIDDDSGDDYVPDDGLVSCPMCSRRMKEDQVYAHLDRCEEEQGGKTANQLRKKLAELGIRNTGSKSQLEKRHTEWVNIWNANCDSERPRSRRELIQDLDGWERSQGSLVPGGLAFNGGGGTGGGGNGAGGSGGGGGGGNGLGSGNNSNGHGSNGINRGNSVMEKTFDGSAWAKSHQDDFRDLIAQARRRRGGTKTKESESESTMNGPGTEPQHSSLDGGVGNLAGEVADDAVTDTVDATYETTSAPTDPPPLPPSSSMFKSPPKSPLSRSVLVADLHRDVNIEMDMDREDPIVDTADTGSGGGGLVSTPF